MYAVLIRASESWRGIQIKPFEAKQLQAVGDELDQEFRDRHSLKSDEVRGCLPLQKIQQESDLTWFGSNSGLATPCYWLRPSKILHVVEGVAPCSEPSGAGRLVNRPAPAGWPGGRPRGSAEMKKEGAVFWVVRPVDLL